VFDTLTTTALVDELTLRLLGGRIQKVLQLDAESIGLEIYVDHQRLYLVVSANSRHPRLYLTSTRLSADPSRVSPLLLLLRKYARGGEIVSIQQPPLERIVRLSIAKRFFVDKNRERSDERQAESDEEQIVTVDLVVEIMGRRSNVILVGETGRIMEAVKRVTSEMSRVRPILPGQQYVPPPAQAKLDPRGLTAAQIVNFGRDVTESTGLASLLLANLAAFSPQMAREAAYRACGNAEAAISGPISWETADFLVAAIKSILEPLESADWHPTIYRQDERVVAYSAILLRQFETDVVAEAVPSISLAIESSAAEESDPAPVRHSQRREQLLAEIKPAVERAATRLHSIEQEQLRARQVEQWRQFGETIYAHIHEIERGQKTLEVDGLSIALDPTLSPSENAQSYFERYRKAQAATANLPELAEAARTELSYLQQLQTLAGLAEGIDAIEAARAEWNEWLHPRVPDTRGRRGPAKSRRRQPIVYRTDRGDAIYIGHNGPENDAVTFDIAGADDEWLHARGVPGGHVIIRWAGEQSDETLEQAASVAAWFSAGRPSTTVEVDATKRRYVRKIKGSGPGMVTYRQERTLRVRPRSPEELGLAK
jgi:predicted ribosome quality control (RQC) complex YloA/Tae2 family protein